MTTPLLQHLLCALPAAMLVMAALWFVQRRTGNAGIVDVAWGLVIAALATAFAGLGGGDAFRRALLAAMALSWGLRLAWHIHARSRGRPEDGRYAQLRREWAPNVQRGLFRFYQYQAVAAVVFSLPFIAPSLNPSPRLSALETGAAVLWLIAFLGETVADAQLERCRRLSRGTKRTCREGLWKYSRHPNYFFEWLVWCAFALFACASPGGWVAVICPVVLLHVLLRVTGIPYAEQQALRSRGDDYRAYQRTTSAFIPWFPRKDKTHVVRPTA